ncbi:MAG: NAD(+) synthase [Treponema sp.]|nr:NAD(+) synthase [Treponema sp.]
MRNYKEETEKRINFIQEIVRSSGLKGIVYGNSGGKDSALTGILCKKACDHTLGIIMPCESRRNYAEDKADAEILSKHYGIETRIIDLSRVKKALTDELSASFTLSASSCNNMAPRLRMTALYAIALSESLLVAGTGNRSESHMGYFTKWGDGAYDFNPIADLTVTEIYEFLRYLDAPDFIFAKAPSAGLFDGQTDESEMGISYKEIDAFLLHGEGTPKSREIINTYHNRSKHKRRVPLNYGSQSDD